MRYWPEPSVTAERDFLDERGAGGLDGHAGQHAAGRVTNGSREGSLGKHSCREQQNDEERQTLQRGSHTERLPFKRVDKDTGARSRLPRHGLHDTGSRPVAYKGGSE